ncbi:beta-galactosidase [Streptomyces nitrosporeus]|uniref:Beta-galactosidase n=1 Tax=Streptomyces nitrosporeus TaxID=28894 RepID=A0A5J6FJL2_9ACTN|nr:beta-galactosidase [Streptomyces nitrosporeus]QEU76017.1 beta-galactosidase [Streptomyces nitrosporeus]GGZ23945.1 beta-galactosidase [Streptomyces nitrosporeus]
MTPALERRWLRPPPDGRPARFAYGADYNPEQWPREVWKEDVRLMREAGVTVVSVAIFSWARLQPAEDRWDFGWLDEILGLLHDNGVSVDLATATASPPPWLTTLHPEILPVTRTGETLSQGARQHWRPTSPVFRRYALKLVEAMATRYADHPALVAWHISNELGCHNVYDYSDDAAGAFRDWLRARYGTVEELNRAWATSFWSQHYGDWAQIQPPRLAASHANPTQQLDFKRFSSDALKDYLRAERAVLRRITPSVPATTNFMVMSGTTGMNYPEWADEIDFVSNDHYAHPGPQRLDELSFSAALTHSIARGEPWFLMEHSTSAVNWQPVNVAKRPGELARDSLVHVAHGADAVCFFQWRQSAAGAEKYHSAMVPHAGPDSEVFRAVAALGRTLDTLTPVTGSLRQPARAALVFDWESWWAVERDSQPSSLLRYRQEALDWYTAFLSLGVRVDVVTTGTDLTGYDFVAAPLLHVVPQDLAGRLERYVNGGGHLATTYYSGIVDEDDHVRLGGYPGALRDLLGIRIEEFGPLLRDAGVTLDNGLTGTLWTDRIDVTDPEVTVLARYTSGDQEGRPALTRRAPATGGSAAYVSTRLGPQGLTAVLGTLLAGAGVSSELPAGVRGRVEAAVRTDGSHAYWFLVNRTEEPVACGTVEGEVLTGPAPAADGLVLPARGVAVLRVAAGTTPFPPHA